MSGAWHGGKGSSPRNTDKNKFDANWDAIFNKDKDKEVDDEREKRNDHRVQSDD